MLNSGKKFALSTTKKKILTLVLSEKQIMNVTKTITPPFKLNGRSLISALRSYLENMLSGPVLSKFSNWILLPLIHPC